MNTNIDLNKKNNEIFLGEITMPESTSKFLLDLMIDIETLGVSDDCVVLSICAVQFNRADIYNNPKKSVLKNPQLRSNSKYKYFSTMVSTLDCLRLGRTIDTSTAEFWSKQKDKSQLIDAMACEIQVKTAIEALNSFLGLATYGLVWAKSPTFDLKILRSLAKSVGVGLNIDFRKEADVRTELHDYPSLDVREISKHLTVKFNEDQVLVHNPFYDCMVQIQAVQEAYAAKFGSAS